MIRKLLCVLLLVGLIACIAGCEELGLAFGDFVNETDNHSNVPSGGWMADKDTAPSKPGVSPSPSTEPSPTEEPSSSPPPSPSATPSPSPTVKLPPPPPIPQPTLSLPPAPSPSVTPSATTPPPTEPTTKPLPKSGSVKTGIKTKKAAPFYVTAPEGTVHYYLKLVDESTGKAYEFFVRAGATFKTKVAYGDYRVRLASGEKWYGEGLYFGANTVYKVSEQVFKFYKKGNTIYGVNLTLKKVDDGNLSTQPIDPKDF